MKIKLLLFLVLILQINFCFSQSRADRYYENQQYMKAIAAYLKKAGNGNQKAIENLAHSFRFVKNYQQAEVWYSKAVSFDNPTPSIHLFYGEILKNNGKLDQAKEQFEILKSKVPGNAQVDSLLYSIEAIKTWNLQQPQYNVKEFEQVNTSGSEFSAVPFKKGLVFVSDRGNDLLGGEVFEGTEKPYLSVYYTEPTAKDNTKYENPVSFSRKINTDYHNGPVSINKEENIVYFTRVNKINSAKKDFVNRPKIYIASFDSKSTRIEPFHLNNDNYSLAHPCISNDGNALYFSSDMPGGFGGMDLYYSKKEGHKWGPALNLGSKINTPGNEVFPFISADDILYFSSAAHVGYGGLDIFYARKINGEWGGVENLKAPINSSFDDFGFSYFELNKKGYITSNRPGGKGDDDIYLFESLKPEIIAISGTIMANELDPAPGVSVKLINSKGDVVQTSETDAKGNFHFERLDPEESYLVMLEDEELNLKTDIKRMYGKIRYNDDLPGSKARLIVVNNERVVVREFTANEKGYFKYENLPADQFTLSTLTEEEVAFINLKINSVSGTLMTNEGKPANGITVTLTDDAGNVIQNGVTDQSGNFIFEKLPPNQNYLVVINDDDPAFNGASAKGIYGKLKYNNGVAASKASLQLVNKDKEVLNNLTADKKGFFYFEKLPSDYQYLTLMDEEEASFKDMRVTSLSGILMKGENTPAPGIEIIVKDEQGKIVATGFTNKKGEFNFEKLNPDYTYLVQIKTTDDDPSQLFGRLKVNGQQTASNATLVYVNSANEPVKEVTADALGMFSYEFLNSEKSFLSLLNASDFNKNINVISGRIFKKENEPASFIKLRLAGTSGKVVKVGTTDAEGSFIFNKLSPDENYTVLINPEDAGYLPGINPTAYGRIKYNNTEAGARAKIALADKDNNILYVLLADVKGFFDFEKLPSEQKFLSLIEEEDTDINIRNSITIVGKVLLDEKSVRGNNVNVFLYTKDGQKVRKAKSDGSGIFRFSHLSPDNQYIIGVDEESESLKKASRFSVHGKVIRNGQMDQPASTRYIALGGGKGMVLKYTDTDLDGFFKFETLASDYFQLATLNDADPALNKKKESGNKNPLAIATSTTSTTAGSKASLQSNLIYFSYGKYKLSESAIEVLDNLAEQMNKNKKLTVELRGHTDPQSSAGHNIILSESRSKSAANYLISKGITPERITTKRFGETKPVNQCTDDVTCSEEELKVNRRVEIILSH